MLAKGLLLFILMTVASLNAAAAGPALSRTALLENLSQWEQDVRSWEAQPEDRLERDVELDWIYRLKSAVIAKYSETDHSLIDLIEDIRDVEKSPENVASSQLIPFLNSLLTAIDEDREPTEPLFDFIKEITETGGIVDPIDPEELATDREYRSRGFSMPAEDLNLDDSAQGLDVTEFAKTLQAELTAEAAVLNAPEGHVSVGPNEVVHGDEPALQTAGDAQVPVAVPAEDSPAQTIYGRIR